MWISGAIRAFVYTKPTDLRKGYNGLFALVRDELAQEPYSGDLFIFTNRRRDSVKVLRWDGTGLTIFMKRLEDGQFVSLVQAGGSDEIELTYSETLLFLEGCQLVGSVALSPSNYSLKSIEESGGRW